jgi:F-type H+-transporting ATPase subunit a
MDGFFPQVVFSVFGIPVRDTIISTWIMMALIVALAAVARRRWPAALEMLVDFLSDTVSDVMGRPAGPYLPFLGALAIFIAVANTIGVVPFLVSPTRDVNTPSSSRSTTLACGPRACWAISRTWLLRSLCCRWRSSGN